MKVFCSKQLGVSRKQNINPAVGNGKLFHRAHSSPVDGPADSRARGNHTFLFRGAPGVKPSLIAF
jgi:hypothetical protein